MSKKKIVIATAICCVTTVLAGCSPKEDIKVTKVSLDKEAFTMEVDSTQKLNATIEPNNASNKNVTWSVSDNKIASVSNNGVVKGLTVGTTSVTVTSVSNPEAKASCTVTVKAKTYDVTGISLNKTTLRLFTGKTEQLIATVEPTEATNKEVTWSSSNTTVATVSNDGKITALKEGTANITVASVAKPSITATCALTVIDEADTWEIDNIVKNKYLQQFESNKSEKQVKDEEFVDRTKLFTIGTDNPINLRPTLMVYDENGVPVNDNLWPYNYIVEVQVKNGSTYEKAGSEYYEVTKALDATIKFKTAAEGKTFKVFITPGWKDGEKYDEDPDFTQIFETNVVNGYNITTADEMSLIDNRPQGVDPDSDSSAGEHEDFDPKWFEFKQEKGWGNIKPSNFVICNDITLTQANIPETFFYTKEELLSYGESEAQADLDKGSLKDPMFLYTRMYGDNCNIYGNYFKIDASQIPLAKRNFGSKSTPTDNRLDSHCSIFRPFSGKFNLFDLNATGNAPKATGGSGDVPGANGGLMLVKANDTATEVTVTNVLARKFYITCMSTGDPHSQNVPPTYNVSKCKFYYNYNCFLYNWGGVMNVSDSELQNCGGPIIISDHVLGTEVSDPVSSPDPTTGEYTFVGKRSKTTFTNCNLKSLVVGTEAWFESFGATALMPDIKAMSDLLALNFGLSYVTDKDGNPVIASTAEVSCLSFLGLGKDTNLLSGNDLPIYGVPEFEFIDNEVSSHFNFHFGEFIELPDGKGGTMYVPKYEFFRAVRDAGAPIFETAGGAIVYDGTGLYDLFDYALFAKGLTPKPSPVDVTHGFYTGRTGYVVPYYQGIGIYMTLYSLPTA